MLDKKMELALNNQLEKEAFSSYSYLAMAVWCDQKAWKDVHNFFTARQKKNICT